MTFHRSIFRSIAVGTLLATGTAAAATQGAHAAAVDHVTNCLSGQPGSFDTVVQHAGAGDTVVFDQDCTGANTIPVSIYLAPFSITTGLTVDGTGHAIAITSGNGLFHVQPTGSLTLKNITSTGVHGYYGSIENQGTLDVENSTFSNGSGNWSAGITNMGTAMISGSTFSGGSGNLSGAVSAFGASTVISNSTFSGNSASLGGAILETNFVGIIPTASIVDSTLTGNSSTQSASLIVAAPLTIANTIVSGTTQGTNCFRTNSTVVTDDGYNLEDDSAKSCGFGAAGSHDIVGQNPQLGALADNGGPTPTVSLASTSPAVDAGACSLADPALTVPTVDQRGVYRPQQNGCDIGAFEYAPPSYTLTVSLHLTAPYTAYTPAQIGNGASTLGTVSASKSLTSTIPFGTPISLTASPVLLGTSSTLTTEFFTGFQTAPPAQLHQNTSTTAYYTTIESILLANRASLGSTTFAQLNSLWTIAERAIAQPYASVSTRETTIKAFSNQVASDEAAGTVSPALGTTLQFYANEAYATVSGTQMP